MQTTNNTKQIFLNKEEFIDELAFNFMQYFNIRSPKESIEEQRMYTDTLNTA